MSVLLQAARTRKRSLGSWNSKKSKESLPGLPWQTKQDIPIKHHHIVNRQNSLQTLAAGLGSTVLAAAVALRREAGPNIP